MGKLVNWVIAGAWMAFVAVYGGVFLWNLMRAGNPPSNPTTYAQMQACGYEGGRRVRPATERCGVVFDDALHLLRMQTVTTDASGVYGGTDVCARAFVDMPVEERAAEFASWVAPMSIAEQHSMSAHLTIQTEVRKRYRCREELQG